MPIPNHISDALTRIHAIVEQKSGVHILHTSEMSRSDRELLLRTHWLEGIIQGWYLVVRPDVPPGDSTTWYANFWGNKQMATSIKRGLAEIGIIVQESNPFNQPKPLIEERGFKSPCVTRIHAMWNEFRIVIIENFTAPKGLPKEEKAYLNQVKELYSQDAYHSLL